MWAPTHSTAVCSPVSWLFFVFFESHLDSESVKIHLTVFLSWLTKYKHSMYLIFLCCSLIIQVILCLLPQFGTTSGSATNLSPLFIHCCHRYLREDVRRRRSRPDKLNRERNWNHVASMDWRVNWYQIRLAFRGSVSLELILLTTNQVSCLSANQLKLNPLMGNNPIITVSSY